VVLCGGLAFGPSAGAQEDPFEQLSLNLEGGGVMAIEIPKSWGKPAFDSGQGVNSIKFGPFGPKEKPVFLAQVIAAVAEVALAPGDLKQVAELEAENVRGVATETAIAINDVQGPSVTGHYFSITDRESKRGEFDYLTMAVLGSSHLLVKCYFFSSDGAPEFGPDAIQLMQSIKYQAPPPEVEADAS
jgi:hypothetical protein